MSWQRISVLALALTLSLLVACDSSPTSPSVSLPTTLQIQVGESVLISPGNLVISLVEVAQDSRCPSSPTIVCVWEGEAVVKIDLSANGRVLGSPLLSTHPDNGSSPNAIRLEGYFLRVVELDPYPVTSGSIPQSDYRLMLRVDRD